MTSRADAQQVAAMVNGEPITSLDIAYRIKLVEVSTHKTLTRKEALEELIDDKLKLAVAKRYTLDITDKEVDNAFNGIARRANATPQQFTKELSGAGVSVESLKARLKADMGWQQIVRGKFQQTLQVGEKDVEKRLQQENKPDTDPVSNEYSLRPIVFIVPHGAPANEFEARWHEAEGLRARFQSCEDGIRMAESLKDVAVRGAIIRSSIDLDAQRRQVLDGTEVGHLTPPEQTIGGVQMFAVCSREQARGDSPDKREARDQIANERFQEQSKRFLDELRRGAMIEIR
jgi:peptidyl-prolyl cis-trans isomerase SurA